MAAFLDFSLDSRIRKKYVPLTNQQRFLRHIKRVTARNLCIPASLIESSFKTQYKNLELYSTSEHDGITAGDGIELDEIDKSQCLLSKLNIAFYFTIVYPANVNCDLCSSNISGLRSSTQLCNCNRVLYRSELVASINPSWRPFEGSTFCSPSISHFIIRLYYVQMRYNDDKFDNASKPFENDDYNGNQDIVDSLFYTDHDSNTYQFNNSKFYENDEKGTLFLEWNTHLSGLIYIGEDMPKDRRLSKNAIIFSFHEGLYTSLCSVISDELLAHIEPPTESRQYRQSMTRISYCVNTLTRIQMVQYIYQATVAKGQRVKNSLENAIQQTKAKRELALKLEKTQSAVDFLSQLLAKRKERLAERKTQVATMENEIMECNMDMSNRLQLLKEQINLIIEFRSVRLVEARQRLEQVRSVLVARRRVLAKELFQDIYRIVPFPDFRGYTICGVFLPDAEHIDQHNWKMISIALGYVTHMTALVTSLLDIHLNYQLIPFGSRSSIVDANSIVLRNSEKMLPLYSRSGRNGLFFKYGFYLLNRTIATIRRMVGLKTPSVAFTLANLYSLFTECLLVDNYNISVDQTLHRYSLYSPSFDLIDISKINQQVAQPSFNQQFLNDINLIKDNDCMIDSLWKELETFTINVTLNRSENSKNVATVSTHQRVPSSTSTIVSVASTSSGSSTNSQSDRRVEEIKQCIAKQRQRRRVVSHQRLSQITSSLSSSYPASVTNPIMIPHTWNNRALQSSLPEDVLRHRRMSSSGGMSDHSPTHGTFMSMANPMSSRLSPRVIPFSNSMQRIRSVSAYNSSPSGNYRPSFLHPNNSLVPSTSPQSNEVASNSNELLNINRNSKFSSKQRVSLHYKQHLHQRLSCSLDKGLNQLQYGNNVNQSSSSITSSLSGQSESRIMCKTSNLHSQLPGMPSSYLNVEIPLSTIRYPSTFEANQSIEEKNTMKVLTIDRTPPQNNSSWLHSQLLSNHSLINHNHVNEANSIVDNNVTLSPFCNDEIHVYQTGHHQNHP